MNTFKKILALLARLALTLLKDETVVAMICAKQAKLLSAGKSAKTMAKAFKIITRIHTAAGVTRTYANAIESATGLPSSSTVVEAGSRLLSAWAKGEKTPEAAAKVLEI